MRFRATTRKGCFLNWVPLLWSPVSLAEPGLTGSPWPTSLVCNLSHTRSRCSTTGSLFEMPLIRFSVPHISGRWRVKTVFRKPTDERVQEFRRSGSFLPGTPQLRIWSSGVHSAPWGYFLLVLSLPLLPLPCPTGLRTTSLPVPLTHGNENEYSLRFLDLFWVIWKYMRLSGALVQCSLDEANTPFGVDLGKGAILKNLPSSRDGGVN